MKSRMLVSLLVIAMAAALIGGGTMAWFTDREVADDVTFTAGTVEVELGDGSISGLGVIDGMEVTNWNPGDCNTIEQEIIYKGSKNAKMRIYPSAEWSLEELSHDNITVTFCDEEYGIEEGGTPADWKEGKNWRFVGSGDNINDYYIEYKGGEGDLQGIIPGTDLEDGVAYELCLKVCIDGPTTGNDYQGETFTLGGEVQVIQASHNDEWTWEEVNFDTGLETTTQP